MESLPSFTISQLQNDADLWWRVHVFIYDLRHFREEVDSQSRLDQIVDASYLGSPYFSDTEVIQLKATALTTGKTLEQEIADTLEERLNRRNKKRVESNSYRVCAAHDLAPIFEIAFSIKPKDLANSPEFLKALKENGLKSCDTWTGLPTKPRCGSKPRPGKKGKR